LRYLGSVNISTSGLSSGTYSVYGSAVNSLSSTPEELGWFEVTANNSPSMTDVTDTDFHKGSVPSFDFSGTDIDGDLVSINVYRDGSFLGSYTSGASMSETSALFSSQVYEFEPVDEFGATGPKVSANFNAINNLPTINISSTDIEIRPGEDASFDYTALDSDGSVVCVLVRNNGGETIYSSNNSSSTVNLVNPSTTDVFVSAQDESGDWSLEERVKITEVNNSPYSTNVNLSSSNFRDVYTHSLALNYENFNQILYASGYFKRKIFRLEAL